MIDREKYSKGGERRPPLKPAVLGNADVAVLTIERVQPEVKTRDGRIAMLVDFEETPEYAYWPGVRSIDRLIEQFGTNERKWLGESVPLVKVMSTNPRTDEDVENYQVAEPSRWADLLKRYTKARLRVQKAPKAPEAETARRARK